MMLSHRQQRIPNSCENCRRRKIRCIGDGTPCQTCIRRGLSSTCRFLKHQVDRSPPVVHSDDPASIVEQMKTLEGLLKENIQLTQSALLGNTLRTISEGTPSSSGESQFARVDTKKPGRLIRSVTGHVRYVGTQSAVLDLSQDSPSINLPFSDRSNTSLQELLDLLPPLSRCDELKDVFMEVFSPLFHVLHDPTFEMEYAAFRNSPHEASFTFLALIFVVLAIGVTALEESHPLLSDLGREVSPGANIRSIAARFRNAAMRTLTADHFMWRHNLQTLQVLILLIYALSHAHGPAWSLLGTTLNIAIAIGCHIDPSRYDVTVVEAEQRRRCWAALLMLYTIQETTLGIQAPIIIQADTQLPADIDDSELSQMASENETGIKVPEFPSKMAYILHKFKLYRLAAEICSSTTSETLSEMEISRLDEMITAEKAEQEHQFAHLESLATYHQAHCLILNSYTNHLYLILHSRILTTASTATTSAKIRSISRLSDASLSILSNYETLRSALAFQRYRWYTDGLGSFHAFLAASTLVAVYGGAHRMEAYTQNKQQVAVSLHRCLDYFRSAANRSDICARAADFLSRLLNLPPSQGLQPNSPHFSLASGHTGRGSGTDAIDTSIIRNNVMPPTPYNHRSPRGEKDSLPAEQPPVPHQQSEPPSAIPDINVDLDGWTTSAEFENFFCQIPTQQWLSPSVFPWSRWDNHEPTRGSEFSQGIGDFII